MKKILIVLASLSFVIFSGNASFSATFCSNNSDCTDSSFPACGPDGACVQCNTDDDCPSTMVCSSVHTCMNVSDLGIKSGRPTISCVCDPLPAGIGTPYPESLCESGTATATVCKPAVTCPGGGVMWQPICN